MAPGGGGGWYEPPCRGVWSCAIAGGGLLLAAALVLFGERVRGALLLGSFLNVVIHRVPVMLERSGGASACECLAAVAMKRRPPRHPTI